MDSQEYISAYIERARKAQAEFEKMSQEQVDKAVQTIGRVVYENAGTSRKSQSRRQAWAMWKTNTPRTDKRPESCGTILEAKSPAVFWRQTRRQASQQLQNQWAWLLQLHLARIL